MSALTEITSLAEFESHLATTLPSTLLVLYFYTPWTAFSTGLGPELSVLTSKYQHSKSHVVSFVSIDGKKLVDIAKRYEVCKAPCVVLLQDGQVLESIRGFDIDKIRVAVERYIGVPDIPAEALEQKRDAITARIAGLVQNPGVILFMKGTPDSPRCRFSRRLVGILREHNIEFDSFDVLNDEDVRQGLKEYGDWPTYPQLWVGGKLLGGLDVVSTLVSLNVCEYVNG